MPGCARCGMRKLIHFHFLELGFAFLRTASSMTKSLCCGDSDGSPPESSHQLLQFIELKNPRLKFPESYWCFIF